MTTSTLTKETRNESYKLIKPKLGERHQQCLSGLVELGGKATANELAMHLFTTKKTPFFNRNFVHPRLNEMVGLNIVEVVGKTKDAMTDRSVAIYKIKKDV